MTTAELLDKVNTRIAAMLDGGAVEAWGEGGHQVRHMSLNQLMAWRQKLEQQLEQETSGILLPITSVDL